jgi:hypothetical protein
MMWCEHCGYRRAMRGLIVCKKCLVEFGRGEHGGAA